MDNKQLFDLMMALLFVTFLLGLSTTTVIFALSFYFRKLDKFLLISPYFNETEQENHEEFPLSLYKTLIYINLFSFRKMTGRRFKGAEIQNPGKGVKALSYVTFFMSRALIILGFSMLSLMLYLHVQL